MLEDAKRLGVQAAGPNGRPVGPEQSGSLERGRSSTRLVNLVTLPLFGNYQAWRDTVSRAWCRSFLPSEAQLAFDEAGTDGQ